MRSETEIERKSIMARCVPQHLIKDRIDSARERLQKCEIDGLIVLSPTNKGYLSGFTTGTNIAPGGVLLITAGEESPHYITSTVDFQECRERLQPRGFEVLRYDYRKGQNALSITVDAARRLGLRKVGVPQSSITAGQLRSYEQEFDQAEILPIEDFIAVLREVKDEWEIKQIRAANRVSSNAFERIIRQVKPGMTEWQLAAELEYRLRLGGEGSPRLAFSSVVVSGPRTCMPHGSVTRRKLQRGDLVTVDFGATCNGYCADITRTFVVGSPTDRQRKIYSAVLQAQLTAIKQVGPGNKRAKAAQRGMDVLGEKGLAEYAVHGAGGHGIGLQVHEGPTTGECGLWEPGNVVTIEPGVYIPGWGGVRIEDDVLVTETGYEVLTPIKKDLLQVKS